MSDDKADYTIPKVDCIIEGLQIFKKYGNVDTAAEHDVFYAGPPYGVVVSKEDHERLEVIRWRVSEDCGGWEIFT